MMMAGGGGRRTGLSNLYLSNYFVILCAKGAFQASNMKLIFEEWNAFFIIWQRVR